MRKKIKNFFEKLLKILKIMFREILGTQNNILLKLKLSLFISSTLIYALAVIFQEESNPEVASIFKFFSGLLLIIFFVLVQNNRTISEFMYEFSRLIVFFFILIVSLNFCISTSLTMHGLYLYIFSTFACLGLFLCTFYFIAKFLDIYNFIKNLFRQIQGKLFNSTNSSTSKITAFIENITALFVAIGGLALAVKAIVEPLANLFK